MTTRQLAIAEAQRNRTAFAQLIANEEEFFRYDFRIDQYIQDYRKSLRGRANPKVSYNLHLTFINNNPYQAYTNVTPLPVFTYRRRIKMVDIAKIFAPLPKLNADGSNYREWYNRVRIMARACAGIARLSPPPAATVLTADEESVDNQMMAAICATLPKVAFNKVMTKDHTYEVMAILKADYDIQTSTVQTVTLQDISTKKCTKDAEIDKHLDWMIDARGRLEESGMIIPDNQFINILEGSVPRAYRDALEARRSSIGDTNKALANVVGHVDLDFTVAEAISIIRSRSKSEQVIKKSEKKEEQANYVSTGGKRPFRGRGRGGRGGGRGDRGDRNSEENKGKSSKQLICYNCEGKGHISKQCPSKRMSRNRSTLR